MTTHAVKAPADPQIAVFPGSFDPLTNGHVELIQRASSIFGRVIVAVLNHPTKQTLFTIEERTQIIREEFQSSERVTVTSFYGLLVDFLKSVNARVVVRGLRAVSDFDYEVQMAMMNRRLSPDVETVFLTTREENSFLSSTIVRQIVQLGGDARLMVPASSEKALKSKLGIAKPK